VRVQVPPPASHEQDQWAEPPRVRGAAGATLGATRDATNWIGPIYELLDASALSRARRFRSSAAFMQRDEGNRASRRFHPARWTAVDFLLRFRGRTAAVNLSPRALLGFGPCRSDDPHAAALAKKADEVSCWVARQKGLIFETSFERKNVCDDFARESRPVGLRFVGFESWARYGRRTLLLTKRSS
jgi:hypothetical protein